jgi:hypothetical protein
MGAQLHGPTALVTAKDPPVHIDQGLGALISILGVKLKTTPKCVIVPNI